MNLRAMSSICLVSFVKYAYKLYKYDYYILYSELIEHLSVLRLFEGEGGRVGRNKVAGMQKA